jgi:hypothetical protein
MNKLEAPGVIPMAIRTYRESKPGTIQSKIYCSFTIQTFGI